MFEGCRCIYVNCTKLNGVCSITITVVFKSYQDKIVVNKCEVGCSFKSIISFFKWLNMTFRGYMSKKALDNNLFPIIFNFDGNFCFSYYSNFIALFHSFIIKRFLFELCPNEAL